MQVSSTTEPLLGKHCQLSKTIAVIPRGEGTTFPFPFLSKLVLNLNASNGIQCKSNKTNNAPKVDLGFILLTQFDHSIIRFGRLYFGNETQVCLYQERLF